MGSTLALGLAMAVALQTAAACGRIGYDAVDVQAGGSSVSGSSAGGSAASADGAKGAGLGSPADSDVASGSGGSGGRYIEAGDAAATPGSGGRAQSDGPLGSGGRPSEVGDSGTSRDAAPEASTRPAPEAGATIQTIGLTDPAQTVRTGATVIGNGELDITPDARNVAGAAYLPRAYSITRTTSFVASFSFRIYNSAGPKGDGFAFLWQNDPRGTAAIGAAGGAIGYGGISPSVVVEFDTQQNTWDPGSNDVAITTDGAYTTALADQAAPFGLADGTTHYAWIEYDAATTEISVFLANTAQRPAAALVSATVDLYTTVGSSAYVGFTAACGVATEVNAIESFTIEYRP